MKAETVGKDGLAAAGRPKTPPVSDDSLPNAGAEEVDGVAADEKEDNGAADEVDEKGKKEGKVMGRSGCWDE